MILLALLCLSLICVLLVFMHEVMPSDFFMIFMVSESYPHEEVGFASGVLVLHHCLQYMIICIKYFLKFFIK